jgi:hypothetical protein
MSQNYVALILCKDVYKKNSHMCYWIFWEGSLSIKNTCYIKCVFGNLVLIKFI